ncbi:unnamed protein product [Moneuplotes crassus]|uniref:LITAF domain-containing protein n=1 Tax=Euplotes crassus TaxID=5936 RepID=A0AAD1XV55_EUPCR|nr:unnamed protein product [Moneuplotes crassus]
MDHNKTNTADDRDSSKKPILGQNIYPKGGSEEPYYPEPIAPNQPTSGYDFRPNQPQPNVNPNPTTFNSYSNQQIQNSNQYTVPTTGVQRGYIVPPAYNNQNVHNVNNQYKQVADCCTGQQSSIGVKCPNPQCNQHTSTVVRRTIGMKMWLCCLLFTAPILIGCIPCCCIPFCVSSWYNYKHYCGHCGLYLGQSQEPGSI